MADSENGHHGTATADVVPSADCPPLPGNNRSRSFPGDFNGGHIEVLDHSDLDLTEDFTIIAWIKRNSSEHCGQIINKHKHSPPAGGSWGLEAPSEGRLNFYVSRGLGTPNLNVLSDVNAVPTLQWAQIAFAYEEPNDHYDYYVNGHLAGSGTAGIAGLIEDTSYDLWFGSLRDDWERASFNGSVDEVQIWNEYVPEPATLSLLALGGLALIRRRRG